MTKKICNIGLVGIPNAGKSTLLNCLLKRELGIVSPKANTTRFSVWGTYKDNEIEVQVTDTPGWATQPQGDLGRMSLGFARSSFMSSSVIGLVIDGASPITNQDAVIFQEAQKLNKPIEMILSKTDLVKPRTELLPKIEQIQQWGYKGVVWLVSAKSGKGIDQLRESILSHATEGTQLDAPTSLTKQKFAEECTREHAFKLLNQEIPYGLWVETKWIQERYELCHIEHDIKILHERHKAIILGAKGQMIKRIGSRSRADLMCHWNQKVRLYLTVKKGTQQDLIMSCR